MQTNLQKIIFGILLFICFLNVLLKLAKIIQQVQTGFGSDRVMTGY